MISAVARLATSRPHEFSGKNMLSREEAERATKSREVDLRPVDAGINNQDEGLFRKSRLLSACRFVEFDTSIICHVLVLRYDSFVSFLLQDMFINLQVFAFEGHDMTGV